MYLDIICTAFIDYPLDGLVSFDFRLPGSVERVPIWPGDDENSLVENWYGSADVDLCNTDEHEPEKVARLAALYGSKDRLMIAMEEAIQAISEECPHCFCEYQPHHPERVHNCSEHWGHNEWERYSYSTETCVEVLKAIVEVVGAAFPCPYGPDGDTDASREWENGNRSKEVLAIAWKNTTEDELCWGGNILKSEGSES